VARYEKCLRATIESDASQRSRRRLPRRAVENVKVLVLEHEQRRVLLCDVQSHTYATLVTKRRKRAVGDSQPPLGTLEAQRVLATRHTRQVEPARRRSPTVNQFLLLWFGEC
jgi:hypothetical protein